MLRKTRLSFSERHYLLWDEFVVSLREWPTWLTAFGMAYAVLSYAIGQYDMLFDGLVIVSLGHVFRRAFFRPERLWILVAIVHIVLLAILWKIMLTPMCNCALGSPLPTSLPLVLKVLDMIGVLP